MFFSKELLLPIPHPQTPWPTQAEVWKMDFQAQTKKQNIPRRNAPELEAATPHAQSSIPNYHAPKLPMLLTLSANTPFDLRCGSGSVVWAADFLLLNMAESAGSVRTAAQNGQSI